MQKAAAERRNDALSHAIRHHMAGRLDEAASLYRQLHEADPADAEITYLMGLLCCDLGLFEVACRFLEDSIDKTDSFPEAHAQLASALNGLAEMALVGGRRSEARLHLQRAVQADPKNVQSLNLLGLVELQEERYAECESTLRAALCMRPDHNQVRNNLGLALFHQQRVAEAAELFAAALALDPAYTGARINLANALRILGRHQEAVTHLDSVLSCVPDCADALNNRAAVAQDIGDGARALACLTRAVALSPEDPRIRWNLALSQLQAGDFANGWTNYESRWEGCAHLRNAQRMPADRRWRGESLHGRRLLLWAEQGYGDTVQFIRFARDLKQSGASVRAYVPRALVRLVRGVAGVAEATGQDEPPPEYDVHCPLMSLPYHLHLRLDRGDLHGSAPYLAGAPEQIAHWRQRLQDFAGLKVGLAWAGSSRGPSAELAAIDARRSIRQASLAPILAAPGCTFFSLQKDGPESDTRFTSVRIHDFSAEWSDFLDTAGFIANLDLVISVDTAVAHLAGALGKPVWLLNRFDSCWRWLLDREDSPWYPGLRQFRQRTAGDWGPPIAAAGAELAALSSAASGGRGRLHQVA